MTGDVYVWVIVLNLIYPDGTNEVMEKVVPNYETCEKEMRMLLSVEPKMLNAKSVGVACMKMDFTSSS